MNKKRAIEAAKREKRREKGQHHKPGRDISKAAEPVALPQTPEPVSSEASEPQTSFAEEMAETGVVAQMVVVSEPVDYDPRNDPILNPETRGHGWWDEVLVYGAADADEAHVGEIIFIDPALALRDEFQPRTIFDEFLLYGLAASIAHDHQQEVAQIYRNPDKSDLAHPWIILNGERRWRACLLANVPYRAEVVDFPGTTLERLVKQVLSNENRVRLTDNEVSVNIRELTNNGMKVVDVARLYCKSIFWVYHHLAFLKLDPRVRAMTSSEIPPEERLAFSTAVKLIDLAADKQYEIAVMLVGKSGVDTREIIRSAIGEGDLRIGSRRRRGSDDLSELRNFLKMCVQRLDLFLRYSDERFGKMLLNIPPKTYVEDFNLEHGVLERLRVLKARMLKHMPKGVVYGKKKNESPVEPNQSPPLDQAPPGFAPSSSAFSGDVIVALSQVDDYFHGQLEQLAETYGKMTQNQLTPLANLLDKARRTMTSFRYQLSKLGVPLQSDVKPEDPSKAPSESVSDTISAAPVTIPKAKPKKDKPRARNPEELVKALELVRDMATMTDSELKAFMKGQPTESLSALGFMLGTTADTLIRTSQGCNRLSRRM